MRILGIISACALAVSVLSAQLIDRFLTERIAVLGSFAGLQLSHNPGIAFGLRLPPVMQEMLIGVALVIVLIVAVRHARPIANSQSPIASIAFGLILGGGIANIVDRIPDGLVTDFIQVGNFPTFNVADSCITIGAALLLWTSLRTHQDAPRNAA